ncbi:MAG: hypothetical protein Fur0022_23140 [Anaerolineales bacterium]
MEKSVPFNLRFGTGVPSSPIDKDAPQSARIGLINIIDKLIRDACFYSWTNIANEALLVGRRLRQEFQNESDEQICISILNEISWEKFYIFVRNFTN